MYHDQLTAARMQRYGSLIESLSIHARQRLARERDTVGYNLAGLRHVAQVRFIEAPCLVNSGHGASLMHHKVPPRRR